jgi:hypothetical protein
MEQTLYRAAFFTDLLPVYTDNKKASPEARLISMIKNQVKTILPGSWLIL